jgi:hypothetical protein
MAAAQLSVVPVPPVESGDTGPVAVVATRTPVLYDLEQHLSSLLDTEDLVPEGQQEEFGREFQATLIATVEKRDRVGQFVCHLKSQIAFAHAETKRLQEREAFFSKVLDRVESYITWTVESLGLDAKGKRKRLEGKTCTLWLHGCDKRVNVTNELAVPNKYQRITLTLPAETWELMCDSLDLDLREQVLSEVKSPKVEVSTSLAKADLKAGAEIPGCELAGGTYVVVD